MFRLQLEMILKTMRIYKWTMKSREELKEVVARRMGSMDLSGEEQRITITMTITITIYRERHRVDEKRRSWEVSSCQGQRLGDTTLASLFSSRVVSCMKGQSGKAPTQLLNFIMMRCMVKSKSWYGFCSAWAIVYSSRLSLPLLFVCDLPGTEPTRLLCTRMVKQNMLTAS